MSPTCLVLLSAVGAAALQPSLASTRTVVPRASRVLLASERWPDAPILDESKDDPVFDRESPYKGRVPYGFSNSAELANGRAAMMGFTILFLQEAIVGQGVLSQYGLPYDAGAVLPLTEGFVLPGPVGLVIALVVTTLALYGGEFVEEKFRQEDTGRDITKLPKLPFM